MIITMEKRRLDVMKYAVIFLSLLLTLTAGCIYIPDEIKSVATPVIQTFEVTPSVINYGETSSLRWQTLNSQSVYIDNGIGNVSTTGTFPISPNTTTSYTLMARNVVGTTTARTQIIVRTQQPTQPTALPSTSPKIIEFFADRTSILPGESAVLKWSVVEATQVILNPIGIVNNSSEIRVFPMETTIYVLTATSPTGSMSSGLTIKVPYVSNQVSKTEAKLILNALPAESGSLIKGTGYLDYVKQDSASVGDTPLNQASRAFLSFDISSIPANAVIEEATLDLSQYLKTGDPSYARSLWGNMGALEVYHLQYGKFDDLGLTAYNQVAKLTQNGVFSSYPISPWAWDVKFASDGSAVVQNLIQTRATRCQFRIQFFTSTNWDSISDMFCFDNATLTVKYTLLE
jgi:hypothetical protein